MEVLPKKSGSALLTQEERQWHKNIMFEGEKDTFYVSALCIWET